MYAASNKLCHIVIAAVDKDGRADRFTAKPHTHKKFEYSLTLLYFSIVAQYVLIYRYDIKIMRLILSMGM